MKELDKLFNELRNCRRCKHFQCFISASAGRCRENPKFADADPDNPSVYPVEAESCEYYNPYEND